MKSSSNTGDPRLIAILTAALAVLFGLVVWLYLSARPPGDGSAEAGFARDMSVHPLKPSVEPSTGTRRKREQRR